MTGRRSSALRKAALILTVSAALVIPTNSATAQPAEDSSDRVVQSLNKCGLGEATMNLHVLFLLDESGSLQWNDPDNKRVDGTIKALDALQLLADRFRGKNINIEVAIHGFAKVYLDHGNTWSPLESNSTLAALRADAEEFRARNLGRWTDYRAAILGATQTLKDREGCKALVWFTDGEYDTEDGGLTGPEIDQIDELCLADGFVDELRDNDITVIAIGLSNEAGGDPPDMALVEAIASGDGVTPRNPDLKLDDGRCGSRPGTGDLYETTNPDELIEKFGEILGDSLFETVEVSAPPLPCTSEANVCIVEFELGPWVHQFTAYFKLPQKFSDEGMTVALDPPGADTTPVPITYPDGPLPGIPGITGESPSRSWRMLTGSADDAAGIWNGVWRIQFKGPGSAEAKANLAFIEGTLEIGLDQDFLDRADPESFGTVHLELMVGNQTLRCNDNNYPVILEFSGQLDDLPPFTAEGKFEPGEQCTVPLRFLLDLLSSDPARDASGLEFEVTPSLRVVADEEVPPLEFAPSPVSLRLENTLVVDLSEGSQLDRTDPATFENVNLELRAGGLTVGCDSASRYPITLVFTGQMGDRPPVTASYRAGERCTVPSDFLKDLLTAGPGRDALRITFQVTPSLVADPAFPPLEFPPSEVSIWLQDALIVNLAEGSRLDRTVPESLEHVGLELFLGNQRFERPAGSRVTLDFSSDTSGRQIDSSATYESDEPFTIPIEFLQEALLDGPGRDLLQLTVEMTPEVILESGGDAEPHPTYEPSTIHIWLHDQVEVRRVDEREVDREERQSYADIGVMLYVGDRPLSDDRARITLDYSSEVAGITIERSHSYPADGPYIIPSGFFDDVFQAAAGSDLLLLSVSVTPKVTIDGAIHPGFEASFLQFAVRTGEGFPTILGITATDFEDGEGSTLTVAMVGPNDGTGTVDIRSISNLPEDIPGTITLVAPRSCEVPNRQRVECTVELDASFAANRTIELDVDLVLSGDRTKVPGQAIQDSVPVKPIQMTRPLNAVNFVTTLLKLLALFVAVQVLLRAFFTTRLARWEGVQADSRWSTIQVKVDETGEVTAEQGGQLAVDPTQAMFASELEGRGSSAEVDGITFEISWMRTFLGEPQGSPFVRQQRALIRATSSTDHCIAPEGMELAAGDRLGTGLVGTRFLRSWVLRLPEDSPQALVAGESVLGQLLVIFRPFDDAGSSAEDQLDEISDMITGVAQREIPRLIEHVAPSDAPEDDGHDSPKGTDGATDDEWSTEQPDPDDPFASTHPMPPTTGSSTETPAVEDWLADPDDPLA